MDSKYEQGLVKDIDESQFNQGSDTVKNIKDKLIAKHGKDKVDKGIAAIEKQRQITDMLTKRRKTLKINQSKIAEAIEVSRNQVIRYEKHQQDPTLTKFLKICEQLGLEVSLMDRETQEVMYHT